MCGSRMTLTCNIYELPSQEVSASAALYRRVTAEGGQLRVSLLFHCLCRSHCDVSAYCPLRRFRALQAGHWLMCCSHA